MDPALPLFRQFLIVRICERIQDICITECSGCKYNHRFAALHPCQKLSLADRVDMFLPRVLTEALDNMEKLVAILPEHFKFTNVHYMLYGSEFVLQLTAKQLFDRRFINEDTALMFEYDDRWFNHDTSDQDFLDHILETCGGIAENVETSCNLEVVPEPKIKKRKANPNVRNVDEIEMQDVPRKPTKAKK